jgi:NAD(P)-dependent dehydrogenase (short-subunit alcohol dehydrogenase family)
VYTKEERYMEEYAGKKVLITGASSGIGKEIAVAFATKGAEIAFSYYSNKSGAEDTQTVLNKMGIKSSAFSVDLSDAGDLDLFLQKVYKEFDEIDIFINNAGLLIPSSNFITTSTQSLQKTISVNFLSPFILTQKIAQRMIDKSIRGSIINISSMSTRFLGTGSTHYECSKAALDALTKGAAYVLAPYHIRVNGIAPGSIATEINIKQRTEDPEGWIKRSKKLPLGEEGKPADIANACLFLSGKDAKWITGTTLVIDGGASLINPF